LKKNFIDVLKNNFIRIMRRDIQYSNDYKKIDRIYIVNDPWFMDSPNEQHRFLETNRLILENFGKVDKLLEIGCGEGHQSLWLQRICDRLIGVDVSARAVDRAQKRCPGKEFLVGDVFSQKVVSKAPYDLVVACEVLYYISDVPAVLKKISELGRNCLVTYFDREIKTLDQHLLLWPGAASKNIEFGGFRWKAAWWRNKRI
jgi:2-polyprenyl-3-methyl-5-hydroxy-6-metoxy-1,4-benzoquinol methylase